MVFSHLFFLYVFLPALFLAYFVIKNDAYRRGVLIVFSLFFYAWGEPVCVFLMIGLVAADYLFGRLINATRVESMRKLWLVCAIVSNLGVLGFYKYLGFLIETLNTVFNVSIPTVTVTMPIGISFFTFQTMSYVIDVYREDAKVQRSYFRLLLYVSFFPQLIAGPIVRYKDIEAQLASRAVSAENFNEGLFRFSRGLAKKVLIADNCAKVIDGLYGLQEATLLGRWAGAVFFTLQLYFDFSGYSDMAIGLGRMFGFRFLENFNYPLISTSATDFWRRWHISLGTFFRDYVYIPLGGNRHDQQRNILVVWFLTGLWHGASWNFILWGLYYAVLLMIEKTTLIKWFERIPKIPSKILGHLYTVIITVFGFAIFYFDHDLFRNLGYLFGIGIASLNDLFTASILADNLFLLAAAIFFAIPVFPMLWKKYGERIPYPAQRILKTAVVILFVGASTVRLVGNSYSPFLYFRF